MYGYYKHQWYCYSDFVQHGTTFVIWFCINIGSCIASKHSSQILLGSCVPKSFVQVLFLLEIVLVGFTVLTKNMVRRSIMKRYLFITLGRIKFGCLKFCLLFKTTKVNTLWNLSSIFLIPSYLIEMNSFFSTIFFYFSIGKYHCCLHLSKK